MQDALGSAIRIDARGREVMRILPRENDAVNEEWISDKTRQVVDGLARQRLDRPYIRENGRLRAASWPEALAAVAAKIKAAPAARIGALVGDLCPVEDVFALKLLCEKLGVTHLDCRQDGARLDPAQGRGSYIFNPTIAGVDEADSLLIVGSNPRREAPVLNARIRKRWLKGGFKISLVGEKADLTYDYDYLGAGPELSAALPAERQIRRAKAHRARRPGRCGARRWRARCWRSLRKRRISSAASVASGTVLQFCTPPLRASARSTLVSCRKPGLRPRRSS